MPEQDRRDRVLPEVPEDWRLTDSGGARPFTSRATYRLPDRSEYVWESRRHRKRRGPAGAAGEAAKAAMPSAETRRGNPWLQFWAPHRLAWWIAVTFIVGSAFFVAGAARTLVPGIFGGSHGMSLFAEVCYFIGALLYTVSIYGQVIESINADDYIGTAPENRPTRKFKWFAFRPRSLAFMTPFVLLIGSLVFNYETTFALGSTLGVLAPLLLWTTSLLGAVLFLISCYMQFIEAGHSYLSWRPRDISWWVAVFFILGSLGFIVGALPGFGAPGLASGGEIFLIKLGFLSGGVFFLIGSYLMLPEMFSS